MERRVYPAPPHSAALPLQPAQIEGSRVRHRCRGPNVRVPGVPRTGVRPGMLSHSRPDLCFSSSSPQSDYSLDPHRRRYARTASATMTERPLNRWSAGCDGRSCEDRNRGVERVPGDLIDGGAELPVPAHSLGAARGYRPVPQDEVKIRVQWSPASAVASRIVDSAGVADRCTPTVVLADSSWRGVDFASK